MGALSDDRGQTLLITAVFIAIAVVAVVGLREAQSHLIASATSHRAGEAAVEAAAASLADAYVAHLSSTRGPTSDALPTTNVAGLIAQPQVIEAARIAADSLARENAAGRVESLSTSCADGRIEVRLVLNGFPHHAGFSAPECTRH
jgi:hypothetical protein